MKNGLSRLFAAGWMLLSGTGAAVAAPVFTPINTPPSGEPGHVSILQTMYGGAWSFTGPTNLDVSSGTLGMFAARVPDGGVASPLSLSGLPTSAADDAVFAGQTVIITARARHAGDKHIFGWIDDTQAVPTFQSIVNSQTMNSPVTLTLSSSFRWALKDTTTGLMFTSRPSDNAGLGSRSAERFDQLVTYEVTGSTMGHAREWALFWEDRIAGQNADYDYNDVVVTVHAIPAPGAGVLGAIGLLLLGRRGRR